METVQNYLTWKEVLEKSPPSSMFHIFTKPSSPPLTMRCPVSRLRWTHFKSCWVKNSPQKWLDTINKFFQLHWDDMYEICDLTKLFRHLLSETIRGVWIFHSNTLSLHLRTYDIYQKLTHQIYKSTWLLDNVKNHFERTSWENKVKKKIQAGISMKR